MTNQRRAVSRMSSFHEHDESIKSRIMVQSRILSFFLSLSRHACIRGHSDFDHIIVSKEMSDLSNSTLNRKDRDNTSNSGRAQAATLEEGKGTEENATLLDTPTMVLKDVPQQTLMAGACFCLASGGMVRDKLLTL